MLHVHRSERADALVPALAAVLGPPPADPFTPDVVAVPTRGVERWLAQRLSHHLGAGTAGEAGVCANVVFGSPARLVGDVVAHVAGRDPESDPWQPDRLTWTVLDVVDGAVHEAWAAPLARYLGDGDDDTRRGRRLGVARRLTRLFASYAAQRPDMVAGWAGARGDAGAPADVPPDLAWQVEVWRRVRERVGEPGPAELLADVVREVAARPGAVDLPERLSVFGPTRLPEDQLRVLHALGAHRDVHVWLPHPSPALWDRVAELSPTSARRADHRTPARHPVLASMARDATELQVRLARLAEHPGAHEHLHHPAPEPPPSLLGRLQRRLRDDDDASPPVDLDPQDRSVEVHACHGLARQVEVLRDVLAGLLADDPTLEPRDVIVMCPDVEVVAPLVAATFGLVDGDGAEAAAAAHPGQALRVRLADRSPRYVNPVLMLLGTLLELADGRVTASEVLDLAASEPVRRRFRLSDDDLARVREWAVEAGVHWGEGAARRARFGLPAVRQGTWDTALDRILLGAAMAEEDHRFVASALPLDDVDGTDVDLAGRLAELLDRLGTVLAELDGARPRDEWLDALDRAVTLLADAAPTEEWQLSQARRVLADVRRTGEGHDGVPLRLPDVRALLADRLQGRPTRAGFRTGALTVCSLEPMRAVPHRVVCLLGLDDGAFPRGGSFDGDDLLLRDPRLGERDPRSEDRQLFLDAVAAASERLVVLYSGADERTGAPRPPAVPVGELLDALDAAAHLPDGRAAREAVVVRHPLQPVDERNFAAGALGRPGPFSFDAHAHAAALAGRGPREGRAPFLREPLPPAGPDEAGPETDLDDLVSALEHPVRWFLRRRLQVSLAGEADDVADRLPLELDPLGQWPLGERLLGALLDGVDPRQALNVEWRRGEVPPKELGRATLLGVQEKVVPVAQAARRYATSRPAGVDVTAELPAGGVVTGTVPGVHGEVVLRSTFSKLGPKHRLRAWVQLLALVVARPEVPWRAVTVGRAPVRAPRAAVSTLRTPTRAEAVRHLGELVALRELASREPLPLPVACACAYATSRDGGAEEVQALEAASQEWSQGFERADDHHVLCWGAGVTLREVAGVPSAAEQAWWPQDRTRLGVLARRVWQPLLAHEETVTL